MTTMASDLVERLRAPCHGCSCPSCRRKRWEAADEIKQQRDYRRTLDQHDKMVSTENRALLEKVEEWQLATGLVCPSEERGGDPGGVTPTHLSEHLRALRERQKRLDILLRDVDPMELGDDFGEAAQICHEEQARIRREDEQAVDGA